MTSQNLPGFTAEAALFRTAANYYMAGMPGSLQSRGSIEPQLMSCGKCSGWLIGKMTCCEITRTDTFPYFTIRCWQNDCGIISDLDPANQPIP